MEMNLAIKTGIINKNNCCIPSEAFKDAVNQERIQELIKHKAFFCEFDIGEDTYTTSMDRVVLRIDSIDVDKLTVNVEKIDNMNVPDINLNDYNVAFSYIAVRDETITEYCLVKKLNIMKAHLILKGTTAYDI